MIGVKTVNKPNWDDSTITEQDEEFLTVSNQESDRELRSCMLDESECEACQ